MRKLATTIAADIYLKHTSRSDWNGSDLAVELFILEELAIDLGSRPKTEAVFEYGIILGARRIESVAMVVEKIGAQIDKLKSTIIEKQCQGDYAMYNHLLVTARSRVKGK